LPESLLALQNAGHEVVEISSKNSFVTPEVDNIGAHASFGGVLLANPAYPASRLLPENTLKNYLETCQWVIVDETLIELTFGGQSMVGFTERYQNLIIIRSFSPSFAIPGMPISYCIAHPKTIALIKRFYDGSNISMFAEALADAVIQEGDYLEKTHDFLEEEIPRMQYMLNIVPGVRIYPAEASFVMCSFSANDSLNFAVQDTPSLVASLLLSGFVVRSLEGMPGIEGKKYFCVALRSHQDNEKLLSAMRHVIVKNE
jgi:threonine-phosphate decarboxylase